MWWIFPGGPRLPHPHIPIFEHISGTIYDRKSKTACTVFIYEHATNSENWCYKNDHMFAYRLPNGVMCYIRLMLHHQSQEPRSPCWVSFRLAGALLLQYGELTYVCDPTIPLVKDSDNLRKLPVREGKKNDIIRWYLEYFYTL